MLEEVLDKRRQIVIVGASGNIGAALFVEAVARGRTPIGTYHRNPKPGLVEFDLIGNRLHDVAPDLDSHHTVIILAAAIDPDWVFANADEAHAINVEYTQRCIDDAHRAGAQVLFMSSEAVFARPSPEGYAESAQPQPDTLYARQKVSVEEYLIGLPRSCVVRTGRNVGWSPENVMCPVAATYRTLLSDDARMAADNIFTLTDSRDTAHGLLDIADSELVGIIHLAANPPICRTALADAVMAASRQGGDMAYETISFSELEYLESRTNCTWIKSDRARQELGLTFRAPFDVIAEKTALLDNWADAGTD